jgi:hypothetical protein
MLTEMKVKQRQLPMANRNLGTATHPKQLPLGARPKVPGILKQDHISSLGPRAGVRTSHQERNKHHGRPYNEHMIPKPQVRFLGDNQDHPSSQQFFSSGPTPSSLPPQVTTFPLPSPHTSRPHLPNPNVNFYPSPKQEKFIPRAFKLQPRAKQEYDGIVERVKPWDHKFRPNLWPTKAARKGTEEVEEVADKIMAEIEQYEHANSCKLTLTARAITVKALSLCEDRGFRPTIHDVLLKECIFCGHMGDIRANWTGKWESRQITSHTSFQCHTKCCGLRVDRNTLQLDGGVCNCGMKLLERIVAPSPQWVNQRNSKGWRESLYELRHEYEFAIEVKTGKLCQIYNLMNKARPFIINMVVISQGEANYDELMQQSDQAITKYIQVIVDSLNDEHRMGGSWNWKKH